jgi:hypothetical protein
VKLCHRSDPKKNSYAEIEVDEDTVSAHLKQGDLYPVNGQCPPRKDHDDHEGAGKGH